MVTTSEGANVNKNTFTNIFITNAQSIRIKEQQQGNKEQGNKETRKQNIFICPIRCTLHISPSFLILAWSPKRLTMPTTWCAGG